MNVKKGQTIWVVDIQLGQIKKCEVESAGPKYFKVKEYPFQKFQQVSMKQVTEYMPKYCVYLTDAEWYNRNEFFDKLDRVKDGIKNLRYSEEGLNKIRQINAILNYI